MIRIGDFIIPEEEIKYIENWNYKQVYIYLKSGEKIVPDVKPEIFYELAEKDDYKEEVIQLKRRIERAIKYMEDTIVFDAPAQMTLNDTYILDSKNYEETIKILKGEENENI